MPTTPNESNARIFSDAIKNPNPANLRALQRYFSQNLPKDDGERLALEAFISSTGYNDDDKNLLLAIIAPKPLVNLPRLDELVRLYAQSLLYH